MGICSGPAQKADQKRPGGQEHRAAFHRLGGRGVAVLIAEAKLKQRG